MLKLNKAYRYTRTEWQHVSTILIPYVRLYGGQKGWDKADNATKDLKNSISEFTLVQQDCRCAYCETLIPGGAQLDHFVPKQLHPEFCYEPKNLLTSCAVCNMYIKNAEDTIILPVKRRYEQNQFTIVHPYFNDPDGVFTAADLRKTMEFVSELYNDGDLRLAVEIIGRDGTASDLEHILREENWFF